MWKRRLRGTCLTLRRNAGPDDTGRESHITCSLSSATQLRLQKRFGSVKGQSDKLQQGKFQQDIKKKKSTFQREQFITGTRLPTETMQQQSWSYSETTGQGSEQFDLTLKLVLLWTWSWDRQPPRISAHVNSSIDTKNNFFHNIGYSLFILHQNLEMLQV